jgi:hypothetical protein
MSSVSVLTTNKTTNTSLLPAKCHIRQSQSGRHLYSESTMIINFPNPGIRLILHDRHVALSLPASGRGPNHSTNLRDCQIDIQCKRFVGSVVVLFVLMNTFASMD